MRIWVQIGALAKKRGDKFDNNKIDRRHRQPDVSVCYCKEHRKYKPN
jgi:hypothetical protein